jgi:hypothetical protein
MDLVIYLKGQPVPNDKSVKNLGLVLNNVFSWENQVNSIFRRVDFALRRHWSIASYAPVRTQRKLAQSLIIPLFLYCYVVCSKTSAGYLDKLQGAFNASARYVYAVLRRDHISDYGNSLLGMLLGKFSNFRYIAKCTRSSLIPQNT